MSNTFTKGYSDGAALTEAELDTALQTLKLDIANSDLATTGSTAGQVLTSNGSGSAASFQALSDPKSIGARNYGLTASTSSGSLTVALKTAAGLNATGSTPIDVTFSSSSSGSSYLKTFSLTASLTLTVTASATLGVTTAKTASLFVYAVYVSSSSLKLAISTDSTLDYGAKKTTTAMSASSDTQGTLYSNASASTYPIKLLGWISASHTAGTWNAIYSVNLAEKTTPFGATVVSGSSGSYINNTTTATQVTNLSCTINCMGGYIEIKLVPIINSSSLQSYIGASYDTGTSINRAYGDLELFRDGAQVAQVVIGAQSGSVYLATNDGVQLPPGAFTAVDKPTVGKHIYLLKARAEGGRQRVVVQNCALMAKEIG